MLQNADIHMSIHTINKGSLKRELGKPHVLPVSFAFMFAHYGMLSDIKHRATAPTNDGLKPLEL